MVYTVKEVAKALHVNVNYVYRLIHTNLLPSLQLGSTKVRKETLEEFLKTYEGKNVDMLVEKIERGEIDVR